jgi:hypothetical protein
VPGAALAFGLGLPPAADGLGAGAERRARTLGALEDAPVREDGLFVAIGRQETSTGLSSVK